MSSGPRPYGWFRKTAYWMAWGFSRVLFGVYFRMQVRGHPAVLPGGPLVVAANHCSFLDPVLLALSLRRRVVFLVTEDMHDLPVLRPLMWVFGCIRVREQGSNLETIKAALRELHAGHLVGIFPEGAISRDGCLMQGELGIAALMLKANAPVLPVGLRGTFQAMPRPARFPRPGKLEVHMGPLLAPGDLTRGLGKAEARRVVRDRVMQEIAEHLPDSQQPPEPSAA